MCLSHTGMAFSPGEVPVWFHPARRGAGMAHRSYRYTSSTHRLSQFSPVSVGDSLGLIQCTPDKQSTAEPLTTWLLKECCGTTAPFITQPVNRPCRNW